jgi:hypothetical protein
VLSPVPLGIKILGSLFIVSGIIAFPISVSVIARADQLPAPVTLADMLLYPLACVFAGVGLLLLRKAA